MEIIFNYFELIIYGEKDNVSEKLFIKKLIYDNFKIEFGKLEICVDLIIIYNKLRNKIFSVFIS